MAGLDIILLLVTNKLQLQVFKSHEANTLL